MTRVGIVGCGAIARQRHAHEYLKHPGVELAGFYDLSKERAAQMTEKFGGKVYETMEDMFSDTSIDLVSICVANAYHAGCTIKALDAGKHVLCEKPMATTLADCEKMLEAAKKNGKRLFIGHNQRLAPAHARAKQLLETGELGKVISFQSTFGHKGPELWSMDKSANTWFFKKDLAAFGSMADLGIHKIDLLCYLLNDKVSSAYATLMTLDKKFPDGKPIEVDDNSVEVLAFTKGAMGTITTSWTHYGEECNATTLYCEKGIMRLYADPRYSLQVVYANGTRVHYELDAMQTNEDVQQTSSGVIDMVVHGIQTGEATVLDAANIIDSMRAVFACLQSAACGNAIQLG